MHSQPGHVLHCCPAPIEKHERCLLSLAPAAHRCPGAKYLYRARTTGTAFPHTFHKPKFGSPILLVLYIEFDARSLCFALVNRRNHDEHLQTPPYGSPSGGAAVLCSALRGDVRMLWRFSQRKNCDENRQPVRHPDLVRLAISCRRAAYPLLFAGSQEEKCANTHVRMCTRRFSR